MHRKGLVIGILILMLGVNIGSSFAGDVDVKTMSPVGFDGNTLYVGGSGPNNYTTIQSAIDDTADGDTVFVYDDSSPYYENINIWKSIKLIGEDKDTTIIDGSENGDVATIYANRVNISGFTIQNSGYGENYWYAGMRIWSISNTIKDNIISLNKGNGISLNEPASNNTIADNIIILNNVVGIFMSNSRDNIIIGNIISNNNYGISIAVHSNNNTIMDNNISSNFVYGIDGWYPSCNLITKNTILNNLKSGISFHYSSSNIITDNNIRTNKEHGIHLASSVDTNIISCNTISSNHQYGVRLFKSKTKIYDNCFLNDSLDVSSPHQNNVTNNTVNGKPLVYLEDESDKIIEADAGQIILIHCNNITIHNQEISYSDVGILLRNTKNCLIYYNNISSNNLHGIYLSASHRNNIMLNNIFYNNKGISLIGSDLNDFTDNHISLNKNHGIYLENSNGNNIINNYISGNDANGLFSDFLCIENNISYNTIISNNNNGIFIDFENYGNSITDNYISLNNNDGICIRHWAAGDGWNTIKNNIINSNKRNGISIYDSGTNNITNNNISNNQQGIYCSGSDNIIENNNFIGNKRQASFRFTRNTNWDSNYWDNWNGIGPKLIFGRIGNFGLIPWLNIDWNPAQEPYDIGV